MHSTPISLPSQNWIFGMNQTVTITEEKRWNSSQQRTEVGDEKGKDKGPSLVRNIPIDDLSRCISEA